jgi:hypothetical protein
MAQEDKGGGGNLPIASIVALVLFTSGLWVQHQPLQSDRPSVSIKQQRDAEIHQDVDARLWQDPLEAVKQAEAESNKDVKSPVAPDVVEEDRRKPVTFLAWMNRSKGKSRLVLPVMVFGGPYAEDAEQRRRTRYAVLSGLRESGFEPDNSRSIGYTRLSGRKVLVPFEKWTRIGVTRSAWEEVYVLWVSEESLGLKPLARLGGVLQDLIPPDDPSIGVTVLGPASNRMALDLADQMVKQTADASAGASTDDGVEISVGERQIRFIAPDLSFTTAALARQLARRSMPPERQEEEAARLDKALDPALKRMRLGPDDAQLARLMVGELANRGVQLSTDPNGRCNDQVALVVEADTHYARSLMREFNALLKSCEPRFTPMVFHYFRGLDGKAAQDDSQSSKSEDGQRDKSKQEYTPYQERAQGQGQFDYLRRIGDEIRLRSDEHQLAVQAPHDKGQQAGSRDSEHRSPDPGSFTSRGAVRAVIVLGSDIHDKLVVLHALRESLPQALFVTTDLDAGLLQKEQLSWTRNVLVGSGFDLQLPPDLQKAAPPFRDTSQSAIFLATRKALVSQDAKGNDLLEQIREVSHRVRLFEIGNQSAVALSVKASDASNPSVRPLGKNSGLGHSWEIFATAVVMTFFLGLAVNWRLRQFLFDLWRRKPYAVGSAVAGAAVLAYFIAILVSVGKVSATSGEEPMRWFAGVSVWPSALICNLAGVLAVAFFVYGRRTLRKGEAAIEEEFFKPDLEQTPPAQAPKGRTHWFNEFYESWFPGSYSEEPASQSHAWAVWLKYKSWGRGRSCALRLALGVAAVFFLAGVMILDLGLPTTPVRGHTSSYLYFFMVIPGYLLTIPLLVWTLDRVALCSLFLFRLYGSDDAPKHSGWSAQTQARYCGCSMPSPTQNASQDIEAVESYIDLRLSARISHYVGTVIVYPFILVLMLIISRARYFDNWGMTAGYLAIIVVILILLTLAAFTLRQNAERIRRYTIEQFESLEVRMRAKDYETTTQTTKEQMALMKEIAIHLKEGAFASFSSQPIVRAVLLPFGGAGLINLLDFALI